MNSALDSLHASFEQFLSRLEPLQSEPPEEPHVENFEKFSSHVEAEVLDAAPVIREAAE